MYGCIHTCMYVYIHVCVYTSMCVYMYVRIHVCVYTCTWAYAGGVDRFERPPLHKMRSPFFK